MKSILLAAVLCATTVCSVSALAQTVTTFTYQGQLNQTGSPADGSFNMEFAIFDALSGGSQVGSSVSIPTQAVSDGVFSSQLDFGYLDYSNNQYWLEIVVDANTLSPRQLITGSPYSIQTRGLFVNLDNNVGIGTSNPAAELHVVADETSLSLTAIRGEQKGPNTSYGVRGSTEGTVASIGVIGTASASTGMNYGGQFTSASTSGRGVYGKATAPTGLTYGGRFESSSSSGGHGVFGAATAATGNTFGAYFVSNSTGGHGVFGLATANTGTTYGGQFTSSSTSGRGVYGVATANTGITDGVFGLSDSTSGRGICGWAPASAGTTYGVFGTSDSTSGTGAFGEARATSGITYGGRFEADSTVGRGIFGFATSNSGVNYGVVGHSNSSSGYDFWASGAGTNYGSPSSRRFKNNIVNIDNPLDKLAMLRGVYFDWDAEHGNAHDVGMIAEEVGKVLPEIVNYEENGVDAIGMDYSKMTPLLVEATNALRAEKDMEIRQLKEGLKQLRLEKDNEIHNLQYRLDRLERMMALDSDK